MKSSAIFLRIFLLALIWLLFTSFFKLPNSQPITEEDNLEVLELNTDGLYYAEFYDYIFRGHFEEIDVKRDDMQFLLIFDQ
ncbi:hypothetical protein CLV90_2238 [Maribacter spongiicola]|uniref:Uncharacterized protein n=1 Tax=Maribacter spongiicola TaxID=1206753 RepID=A0A4R7K3Y5_9FLAO|nr:hypothetical protein [Maribacter spongiicola]TDT45154.1 hypothetical protein CLV90_2238 [Maribacter spongiicola]